MKILVFLAAAATALTLCSAAFANSISCSHGNNCHSGTLGGSAGTGSHPDGGGSGTLPFTGADLGGIAGVAGLLLVSGVTLRRAGRRRDNS
jgi:hypothetical protein